MEKFKIIVPIGCRSDEGLSAPIIRRLIEDPTFDVRSLQLKAANFGVSYGLTEDFIKLNQPDFILCVGDRIEMTAAASAAFHNNISLGHVYAGVVNTPISTLDDINRYCITLWSELAFCEDYMSACRTKALWNHIGRVGMTGLELIDMKKDNIHVVGITHLDDLVIDESLVPKEEYNLVLLNPTTMYEESRMWVRERKTIIIGSNPDQISCGEIDYQNLPRPQFLGLMKNCMKFITNSSCAYYEAPYFLKPEQIVLLGDRNKNRSTPKKLETGASDKIVKILKDYWREKN